MPIEAKLYRVLIASPGDVADERAIVREEIARWNAMHSETMKIVLLPTGWERDATPDLRERGQAVINRQLVDNCDLLIGVFWTRIGTPTPEAESGTVEEIERAAAEGKRCIVYFSDQPVSPSTVDPEQYERLQQYKKELNQRGLTCLYEDNSEFKEKVSRHITTAIQEIVREDRERRAAEQEARVTEQAIRLDIQPNQQLTTLNFELTNLIDSQATVKQLLESKFGIQDLEDIKEREIAEIQDALNSPDLSVLFNQQPTTESVSAIAQVIEAISTPSMLAIASIGKYGDDTSIDWLEIVGDWVEQLSTSKSESGYTWVSYIKTYPGLLTFYSIGISALRSGKINFLKEVIERQIYSREYDRELPLVAAIDPRYVFYHDVQKFIEPGFERRYTPISDHLAPLIKSKLYPNDVEASYLEWFDLFEFLVCLKSVQLNREDPYFGSFAWRTETNRFIVKAIQEASLEKSRLGIAISKLFDGSQQLEEAAKIYDKIAGQVRWNFGRGGVPAYISKSIKLAKNEQRVISYRDLLNRLNQST
jgi:nucleoside 2-deoxyribosyltransferase